MRHQPGMQPRRPLHPAPRRQQQERSGRQHRQEHPRHTKPQRHGSQYDQQIIHAPKVTKIICPPLPGHIIRSTFHNGSKSRNSVPLRQQPFLCTLSTGPCTASSLRSPFPQRQQNPRFSAVAEAAFPVYPLYRPLYDIFPPFPLSTTVANPDDIFPPFPLSTTVANPAIRCRCGSHRQSVCYGSYFAKRQKLRALCHSLELQTEGYTSLSVLP